MTPREVVAQALDYASYVQKLGLSDIERIIESKDFFDGKSLNEVFRDKFGDDLPEFVNQAHRIYIVASALDSRTERIIEYLSETHRVDINAATFTYFKTPDGELIGRSMLLDEEAQPGTEKDPRTTWRAATLEELKGIAVEKAVGDLWEKAYKEFESISGGTLRKKDSLLFRVRIDGSITWVVKMYPTHSSQERGLAISLNDHNIERHFALSPEHLSAVRTEEIAGLWSTYHFDDDRLDKLIELLKKNAPEG